jgi:threonine aldolase
MRQAGIVAAAGLLALSAGPDGMINRLSEDHVNARLLAEGLAELDVVESPGGIAQQTPGRLDPQRVRTNFVIFRVKGNRSGFIDAMSAQGVLLMPYGHDQIRAVTHAGISRSDIESALSRIGDVATSRVAS